MPSISVIMPVYNSEKYLYDAIRSVLNQTFQDFELILVDDGSTDRSGAICDEYSLKDKRIRVIHKENGGICSARNMGIDHAAGQYIAFCDNDDRYLPKLLEDNFKLAVEHNADMVRFKRLQIKIGKDGKSANSTNPPFRFCVLKGNEIWKNYNQVKAAYIGVWTGLYSKEFIDQNHIRFNTLMKYGAEDRCFNLDIYKKCNCIVLNPKIYYYWIMRKSHSTTAKFNINLVNSLLYCIKKEYLIYYNNHIDKYLPHYWEYIQREYLFEIFRYLNREVCNLNFLQKINILKKIRDQDAFSYEFTWKRLSVLYKKDKMECIMWYSFYKKHFIILYYILKIITI